MKSPDELDFCVRRLLICAFCEDGVSGLNKKFLGDFSSVFESRQGVEETANGS